MERPVICLSVRINLQAWASVARLDDVVVLMPRAEIWNLVRAHIVGKGPGRLMERPVNCLSVRINLQAWGSVARFEDVDVLKPRAQIWNLVRAHIVGNGPGS